MELFQTLLLSLSYHPQKAVIFSLKTNHNANLASWLVEFDAAVQEFYNVKAGSFGLTRLTFYGLRKIMTKPCIFGGHPKASDKDMLFKYVVSLIFSAAHEYRLIQNNRTLTSSLRATCSSTARRSLKLKTILYN
jgi:hypothetical protein